MAKRKKSQTTKRALAQRIQAVERKLAAQEAERAPTLAEQRAGNELRRKALSLPKLNSTAAARKWLALVGQAVSQGQLKLSVAKELRLTASAYLASDRDGALADRLSELEQRLRDGEEIEAEEA